MQRPDPRVQDGGTGCEHAHADLHELHIHKLGACQIAQRVAVTRHFLWIQRVPEQPSRAAAGKDHRTRADHGHTSLRRERHRTDATSVLNQELCDHDVFEDLRILIQRVLQRPDDLCSVSAKIVIARKRPEATLRNKIISVFFFKFHAERFQLLYRSDRFLHKRPNDIWVAHAVSCAHDVRVMHIRTVLCAAPSVGDAEPGCFRYRIAGSPGGTDRSLYRQNDVRAAVLRGDCRAHSCDACTNDQNIAAFCLLHMHLSVSAAPGRKRFHA